jgi:two-component system cell cycle sensor histidine kinase/response regulator CckA
VATPQILIVEDEDIIAMDLENKLKSMGYAVAALASSGQEAVRKAAAIQPDLVLMDIRLKGAMDGVTAAHQIRALYDIPVIYLTAHADDYTLHRAKKTEPVGYILKPFEDKELRASIELALHNHGVENQLRKTERWLATTLKSIGEAIIASDENGRVAFMNPVAEALTGWRQEEALGKDLAEVFHAIDEQTRQPIENPLAEVMRREINPGLERPTLLIARGGTEKPIERTASPIQDDNGYVNGVVLVFRSVGERK